MGIMDRLPPGVPPEMCGNMVPQKAKATVKEEMEYRPMLEKLADWARKNPGSAGTPDGLQKGGPGDSDCISVFLASILYAAKQRVRLVIAIGQAEDGGQFITRLAGSDGVGRINYGRSDKYDDAPPKAVSRARPTTLSVTLQSARSVPWTKLLS